MKVPARHGESAHMEGTLRLGSAKQGSGHVATPAQTRDLETGTIPTTKALTFLRALAVNLSNTRHSDPAGTELDYRLSLKILLICELEP